MYTMLWRCIDCLADFIAQDVYKTYFNKSEATELQSGYQKLKVHE